MKMKQPTQNEMKAFFQGYEQREAEICRALVEARKKKQNAIAAIRNSYKKNGTAWKLRAETKGYNTLPGSDHILHALVLSLAFVAIFLAWVIT